MTRVESGAALIDLGDRTPVWDTPPSDRMALRRRRVTAVGVALVCLLTLVAASGTIATKNPLPLLATLPAGDDAHVLVQGARAFVLDTAPGGDAARISAYALRGGHRLWSSRVAGQTIGAYAFTEGAVLIVVAPEADGGDLLIESFDLASGRPLWTVAGSDVLRTAAGLLVEHQDVTIVNSTPNIMMQTATIQLESIDPSTGHLGWTVPLADGCTPEVTDAGSSIGGLVEVCDGGRNASVIDPRSGRVEVRRSLEIPAVDTDAQPTVTVIGGIVVVSTAMVSPLGVVGLYVAAFRAADLTPLWRNPTGVATLVNACDTTLCLSGPDGVTTVDPQTGRVIATQRPAPPAADLAPAGVREFIVVPIGVPPVADPAGPDATVEPMQSTGVSMDLPMSGRLGSTATWISEEQHDLTIRPYAPLPSTASDCIFLGGYVVCRTAGAQIGVWRLAL